MALGKFTTVTDLSLPFHNHIILNQDKNRNYPNKGKKKRKKILHVATKIIVHYLEVLKTRGKHLQFIYKYLAERSVTFNTTESF